jgi:plasmid stabilization system protein ParE
MRGQFQVFWTKTAQQDLKKIIDYIATDSTVNAGRVYQDIKNKSENLYQMPYQGRIVPELRYFGILIYRELIISPWRQIYKIEDHKVWILAVIDGRRNVEDILLGRFIE